MFQFQTATCQEIAGDVGDEAVILPDFLVTVSPHPHVIADFFLRTSIFQANLPTIRPLVLSTLDSDFWVRVQNLLFETSKV